MSIYTDEGYENRRAYLDSLADDFGLDKSTVYALALIKGMGYEIEVKHPETTF